MRYGEFKKPKSLGDDESTEPLDSSSDLIREHLGTSTKSLCELLENKWRETYPEFYVEYSPQFEKAEWLEERDSMVNIVYRLDTSLDAVSEETKIMIREMLGPLADLLCKTLNHGIAISLVLPTTA